MRENSICTARHLNHVAIAVTDIEGTLSFYRRVFGLEEAAIEEIADQGVRAALVQLGGSQLEFLQPSDPAGGVARFIARSGEGLHHICLEVEDLDGTLERLDAGDIELIDKAPREGLAGMIAFMHPRATRGVLVELVDRDTTGR